MGYRQRCGPRSEESSVSLCDCVCVFTPFPPKSKPASGAAFKTCRWLAAQSGAVPMASRPLCYVSEWVELCCLLSFKGWCVGVHAWVFVFQPYIQGNMCKCVYICVGICVCVCVSVSVCLRVLSTGTVSIIFSFLLFPLLFLLIVLFSPPTLDLKKRMMQLRTEAASHLRELMSPPSGPGRPLHATQLWCHGTCQMLVGALPSSVLSLALTHTHT